MTLVKKVANGILYKGGMLGTGIVCLFLWKGRYLPEYTGAISLSATSVGFCGVVWYIWKVMGKKHKSSKELEEIVEALYRKLLSKMEERVAKQEIEHVTEGKEEKRQALDKCEQASCRIADHGESSNRKTLPESAEDGSGVSRHALFLKKCAEVFRKHKIPEAKDGKTNEDDITAEELKLLADKVEAAAIRELTRNENELSAKKGRLTKNLFREIEDCTLTDRKEEVFEASELFKDLDTRRPAIEKELASLVWRGNGMNFLKPSTKRLRHKSGKTSE